MVKKMKFQKNMVQKKASKKVVKKGKKKVQMTQAMRDMKLAKRMGHPSVMSKC